MQADSANQVVYWLSISRGRRGQTQVGIPQQTFFQGLLLPVLLTSCAQSDQILVVIVRAKLTISKRLCVHWEKFNDFIIQAQMLVLVYQQCLNECSKLCLPHAYFKASPAMPSVQCAYVQCYIPMCHTSIPMCIVGTLCSTLVIVCQLHVFHSCYFIFWLFRLFTLKLPSQLQESQCFTLLQPKK